jgi:SNF2 family DNA or RNA helicase
VKIHGTATLVEHDGDKLWVIETSPHVMTRLKRVFARINPGQHGKVTLSDSSENATELIWFIQRFPLEVRPLKYLKERAAEHARQEALIQEVLAEGYKPPDFKMALPPRDYQAVVGDLVLRSGALLCADEVGLGKTIEALTMLSDKRALPGLVATMPHLQKQWKDEIERFLPGLRVHILKKGTPYDLTRRRRQKVPAPDVILSSYHKLTGWAATLAERCNSATFDEMQELRLTTSLKYSAAQHITSKVKFKLGLTATPIYNYGDEIHSVLSVLKPDALGTRHEFIREWCSGGSQQEDTTVETKRGAKVKDPRALGLHLREQGLMLRRTRPEVGREIPKVESIPFPIEADIEALNRVEASAAELARIILTQGGLARGVKMQAAEEFSNLLRQATGIAKAPYVADFVRMLVEGGEKVVLFGWHRAVYDIWLSKLSDLGPVLYTGSESPARKEVNKTLFTEGHAKILIISNRSGAGLDGLQFVCRTAVIGELDWSPAVQLQNIGRIARDGQPHPVAAYIPLAQTGCDPTMADVLGLKRAQAEAIVDPDAPLVEHLQQVDEDRIKKLAQAYLAQSGSSFSASKEEPAEVA